MIETASPATSIAFNNLQNAFATKSDRDLRKAYWLFKAMGSNLLVRNGPVLLDIALKLHIPVLPVIRATLFKHFCGGENIAECNNTIAALHRAGIGSVLDYSIEGEEKESVFDSTTKELLATIDRAKGDPAVPFCVFKVTGIARFTCLEKISSGNAVAESDNREFEKIRQRVLTICEHAATARVRIFIDAEESWIQPAIDALADEMMKRFNKEGQAVVFNTIQLYRSDRLAFLKESHQKAVQEGYKLGLKLVRGAYMEKERERALKNNYPSPIQPNWNATNIDYDAALKYCVEHISEIEICAGTHNEASCKLLVSLMSDARLAANDYRIWFSQLLGMSDHISYNLAAAGFNVAKYVPYGPVKSVLPYLIRRAMENTSIAGQTGRELKMIHDEKIRRRSQKKG
ncbi:MAG TPA: proline dehydrogenase family protein [Bacteroidia bacterium]|nr:proline dehydrogenase family protein [Bacteroidia bacterium]